MTASTAKLSVSGLRLTFGGVVALEDVGFSVRGGEMVGIVGTNGSGKTSLLNCISGAYRPERGEIALDGGRIDGLRPHRVTRLGVARTFQHAEAPPEMTVADVALLGRHSAMARFGTVAYGLGLPFVTGHEAEHRRRALEVLERVGLADFSTIPVGDLPYGLAKRVDLARALAGEPKLLLLDEPAAGLNEVERRHLSEIVASLATEEMTVLLVEHDMGFVARVCPRVMVFVDGRLLYDGPTEEAMRDERVVESFLGGAFGTVGAA